MIINHLYKETYKKIMVFTTFGISLLFLSIEGIFFWISLLGFLITSILVIKNSIRLFKTIPSSMPWIPFAIAALFIVGGMCMDLGTTFWFSPNLAREANPIFRKLLDFNVPLNVVSCLIVFILSVMTIIPMLLWGCFLKTYRTRLYELPYKNILTTTRWMCGAGNCSFFDWLLSRNINFYFALSATSVGFVTINAVHWYASFEWLEIIPISFIARGVFVSSVFFGTIIALALFTHNKLRIHHQNLSYKADEALPIG